MGARKIVCCALWLLGLVGAITACGDETVVGSGSSGSSGDTPGSSSGSSTAAQCKEDADCAAFDVDQDVCTRAFCSSGRCRQELVRGTPECQCHEPKDCEYFEDTCSSGKCTAHKCEQILAPAGPSPKDKAGDCQKITCDGAARAGVEEDDATDLPDDDNPCTVDGCGTFGPTHDQVADGTSCGGDGSFCFRGKCMKCAPQNPTSCGGEGPNEPANGNAASAGTITEYAPFCAYSNSSDTDWYTFQASDDFGFDLMRVNFHSDAPSIEVCIYVACSNGGEPMGACESKLAGPANSKGCCWTGAPNSLAPTWDLDCSGTTEDEGAVYISVKTPGANACVFYAMSAGY